MGKGPDKGIEEGMEDGIGEGMDKGPILVHRRPQRTSG
jgi:hypothetical protein